MVLHMGRAAVKIKLENIHVDPLQTVEDTLSAATAFYTTE